MNPAEDDLKQTPLLDKHKELQAKIVPFGGWAMPVQYTGILAEHAHCRQKASLFDTCHMGIFFIKADAADSGFSNIFSFRIDDLKTNHSRYGCMLNHKGGIIDDLIVFRIAQEEWMIVVNAGTTVKDAKHIQGHLSNAADFKNVSSELVKIDLQGPKSSTVIDEVLHCDVRRLKFFTFDYFDFLGQRNIISRTGYTGELGYEIFIDSNLVPRLWDNLLAHPDTAPAGLGARDTLRLEMGYSLYGHELNEETTPLDAGLEAFVHFDKDFIGKKRLLEQKEKNKFRHRIAFKSASRRSPRQGHKIFDGEKQIGVVTSGSFSPSLGCGIGIGILEDAAGVTDGKTLHVGDSPGALEVFSCALPFYRDGTARIKNPQIA